MLKLKLPEYLDYNLDIRFISILMYLIWQFGASGKKAEQNHFHLIKDDNLLQIKQIKSDSYGYIKLDNRLGLFKAGLFVNKSHQLEPIRSQGPPVIPKWM